MRLFPIAPLATVLAAASLSAAPMAPWDPARAVPASLEAPSLAQEPMTWRVREPDSSVRFVITKLGAFRVEGRFRKVSGSIQMDREHPERSRVRVVVDAASIDTGVEGRDRAVRSADLLDVARFPLLTFVSTNVEREGSDPEAVRVTGDLTIHGVTRRVTVPARLLAASRTGEGELAGFECRFEVDRRDYGVGLRGFAPSFIGHEVSVQILLGAQRLLR